MKKVNVNKMLEIKANINRFNNEDIEDLEFYYNYEKVDIPKDVIDNFMFTGLSNIDFITMYNWDNNVCDNLVSRNIKRIVERIEEHYAMTSESSDMYDVNGDYNEFCYDGGYLAALEEVLNIIKDISGGDKNDKK